MNFKNHYRSSKDFNSYLFFIETNFWIERNLYIHNKANETMMYRFMNVICCKWSSCGNNDTNSKMLLRKKETT